ncbi:hypothetical protein NLI96_g2421 [Meripilus lineatus]|uniref:Peroxisomal targeting signal receptor n=1 Tax=Meripilus lineatus TaxID=2056292 RepID=A0AAD5V8T4_9APHY|nr:hypothetical protein NLI96_g2421 [Physisporinus lineatus]
MSLQGLISGSECATPFNPLSQVLKHTESDRSIQQDRIAGPSSARLQHLPSTATIPGSERDIALARQFFDGTAAPQNAGPSFSVPQHLPPPPMEAARFVSPDLNVAWAESQQRKFLQNQAPPELKSQNWSGEFGNASQITSPGSAAQQNTPNQQEFFQPTYMQPRMYGSTMGMGMYSAIPPPAQALDKGKGKSREIDFEAAFAQVDQDLSTTQSARIVELDDTADLAEALKQTSLGDDVDEQTAPIGTDFKSVWDQLQKSELPPPDEDIAKWEAEYNQLMSSQRDDLDYGEAMQGAWENGLGDYDPQDEHVKFDDEGLPILGDYLFERDNKYLDPTTSNRSNLTEAKLLLEQNGSLTEAALLLEAAIQQGELGKGGYEAWVLLGEVRSMDEREEAGMRALMEGVKRAEQAGDVGEGMLSLAISFTNESYERASHTMLLRWLSARYPSHPIPEDTWKSLSQTSWHSHELVTETFLSLARQQHAEDRLDPDVQICLGVLFYTNNEFDRAKDCFEAALTVRPNDYLLWNRLGSSLSNGNNPEEALGAYREALQLRPTYTRAIYNVGVACLNIGANKEAAEHFLSALAMQDSSSGAKSDQLWFTLRRAFLAMNRLDLAGIANTEADLDIFRKEGFDF